MRRSTLLLTAGVLSIVGLALLLTSCSGQMSNPMKSSDITGLNAVTSASPVGSDSSSHGQPIQMTAYYDSVLFNINFTELPASAETALLAHNKSLNHIYETDPDLPGAQPFIPALDAIQGDGFNPLWIEVEITFNPGFTPRQFYSDNQVLAAASGTNPEITLTQTSEVYRCAVLGPKK